MYNGLHIRCIYCVKEPGFTVFFSTECRFSVFYVFPGGRAHFVKMTHWFHRNPLKATAPVSFNYYGMITGPPASKICK